MTLVAPEAELTAPERWETAPPGLNEAEFAWWERFSGVEEEYCWVQTPPIQRFIRGHYLRRIAAAIPAGGTVLELGCGTGWLSLLLAKYGAASVCGVEFSAEQIRRAEADCRRQGLEDRVRFVRLHTSLADLEGETGAGFDALVVHGVLHHLTNAEIREVMETFCCRLAKPGARVFILEPVLYSPDENSPQVQRLARLMDRLINLPLAGRRLGIRRRTPAEAAVQEQLAARNVGIPPRGPSPKEMPFRPGEMERVLSPYVEVESLAPVLGFSFLTAKNLLLTQISHPMWGRLLMWPYLWVARAYEQRILADHPRESRLPVFELLQGTVRGGGREL